jgi:glutamine synthetase
MIENKVLLEYIWIDNFENLRSKIKIMNINQLPKITIDYIPEWNFDGSSTGQAEGRDSDVLVKPVSLFKNPFHKYIKEAYLVLCECFNKDGTVHPTNHRHKLVDTFEKCKDTEPLFGIEQEYVILSRQKSIRCEINKKSEIEHNYKNMPYNWEKHDEPGSGGQGPYYCSVGGGVCFGREISDAHLQYCLEAGLSICGTNAEVMASQWEYQVGALPPIELADQLWISRYILHKVSEMYNCIITFHPKPYKGDWNGSGGHTNFSTKEMRGENDENGLEHIKEACLKLEKNHLEHMKVYGKYNEERLTGIHETSSINDFSWGISNRGRSIRIPLNVAKDGCGYFEDRRPASNIDPYLVCEKLCSTICL